MDEWNVSELMGENGNVLNQIWLAAHINSRLTKNQINQTELLDCFSCLNELESSQIDLSICGYLIRGIVYIIRQKFSVAKEGIIKMQNVIGRSVTDVHIIVDLNKLPQYIFDTQICDISLNTKALNKENVSGDEGESVVSLEILKPKAKKRFRKRIPTAQKPTKSVSIAAPEYLPQQLPATTMQEINELIDSVRQSPLKTKKNFSILDSLVDKRTEREKFQTLEVNEQVAYDFDMDHSNLFPADVDMEIRDMTLTEENIDIHNSTIGEMDNVRSLELPEQLSSIKEVTMNKTMNDSRVTDVEETPTPLRRSRRKSVMRKTQSKLPLNFRSISIRFTDEYFNTLRRKRLPIERNFVDNHISKALKSCTKTWKVLCDSDPLMEPIIIDESNLLVLNDLEVTDDHFFLPETVEHEQEIETIIHNDGTVEEGAKNDNEQYMGQLSKRRHVDSLDNLPSFQPESMTADDVVAFDQLRTTDDAIYDNFENESLLRNENLSNHSIHFLKSSMKQMENLNEESLNLLNNLAECLQFRESIYFSDIISLNKQNGKRPAQCFSNLLHLLNKDLFGAEQEMRKSFNDSSYIQDIRIFPLSKI
ncbi:hypothetical protein SNEBB_010136 [Seison nebaliae]|nr:hypothetical protein SNEBB_010136 [Seison nebaliae]